jgi:polyribonucleotide 5'-hydroxyl-kinase
VRLARKPTYVNLDVGAGHITVPGTLSAAALDSSVMSVEQGFSLAAPLVFWYGHTAADETPDLYKQLVTKLAECVDSRLANDREAAAAGLIINTPGWVNSKGLELLKHAVDVVRADVILVVDDDKLLAEIQGHVQESTKEVGRSPVTVLKVPKSGGVVRRLPQDLRQERNESMRQYFYGSRNPEWLGAGAALTPSVLELRFEEVVLCRVGGEKLSDGLLPVGQVAMLGPLQVTRIQPTAALTHSILAVCHPLLRADGTVLGQTGEEDELGHELVDSNVAGFIFITDVDMERKRLVMLSPCPGSLPSKYLLWGDIKWVE